jgi:hypothetical protein
VDQLHGRDPTVGTGAAVYAQGLGFASENGGGAVQPLGVGPIDPITGKALSWNPRLARNFLLTG